MGRAATASGDSEGEAQTELRPASQDLEGYGMRPFRDLRLRHVKTPAEDDVRQATSSGMLRTALNVSGSDDFQKSPGQ